MIIYFRKGARVIELLLAKDTLRPGMLTKGYVFMVIESDSRGHLGIMPSEREHFDLEWMASAAFWTKARQLSDRGWEADGYPSAVILLKYYEASDMAGKKKHALKRKQAKGQALCQKALKPRCCASCGHLFRPSGSNQKYCSIDCQKRHWQEAHRRKKKEKRG
ncbi:MAG TPA: hypothetical protein DCG08_03475 [Dialister sp.]|nr:hypothetical protein [Dialister sp.]